MVVLQTYQKVFQELLVVGGTKAQDQMNALNAGVDIVVATPGRLEDLIRYDHSLPHLYSVLDRRFRIRVLLNLSKLMSISNTEVKSKKKMC